MISELNQSNPDSTSARLDINPIDELVEMGLDQAIADELLEFMDEHMFVSDRDMETTVVVLFLSILVKHKGCYRHFKRLMRQAGKQILVPVSLVKQVAALV